MFDMNIVHIPESQIISENGKEYTVSEICLVSGCEHHHVIVWSTESVTVIGERLM